MTLLVSVTPAMSLDDRIARAVWRATVRLPRLVGQGVLVPGNLVLTAAHCVGWSCDGSMVSSSDLLSEDVVTSDGATLAVAPFAVDPVSDLAILGEVDNQERPAEADAFETFCDATEPVRLATADLELFVPIDGFVFTHRNTITPARVSQVRTDATYLVIETDVPIEGGTSGGPVVNAAGELLGIVSWSQNPSCVGRAMRGSIQRPHLAAPVWAVHRMMAAPHPS